MIHPLTWSFPTDKGKGDTFQRGAMKVMQEDELQSTVPVLTGGEA